MKKILILVFLLIIIELLQFNEIILINESINNTMLVFMAIYGAISYKKEFQYWQNWLASLLLISIGGMMLNLLLVSLTKNSIPVIVSVGIGFGVSFAVITYLFQKEAIKNFKKISILGMGYYFTLVFIGHILLAINLNGGLFPSPKEKVYSKCIDVRCIDIHKTKWKLSFYTVYSYSGDIDFVKYKETSPDITTTSFAFLGNIDPEFNFIHDDGSYILKYRSEGKEKSISINYD